MSQNISEIRKRDGSIVPFEKSKIVNAILKAAISVGGKNREEAEKITDVVIEELEKNLEGIPTVEHVQDTIEKVLIELGHAKTAKAYIVYRQKRAELREQKMRLLEKDFLDDVDKNFDLNALRVLKARYLKKDEKGKLIETPKQLFTRVAIHAALPDIFYDEKVYDISSKQNSFELPDFNQAEFDNKFSIGKYKLNQYHMEGIRRIYGRYNKEKNMKVSWSQFLDLLNNNYFNKYEKAIDDFYGLMVEKKFMPNTPAIANFGNSLGMGSACFVLGIEDSMESIMDTLKHTAIIHKSGGGTGFNFSKIRPEGDFVSSTSGAASGPLSFMKMFDTMTEVVKQGGIRRGANMGILNSNHPDIEKFITAKEGNKGLRNFNISVLIMPDFWDYYNKNEPYPLINPRNDEVVRTVNPKMLFDKIVYQAWESAEPGVIFHDTSNKYNPFYEHLGPIVTTNPCVAGDTLVPTKSGLMSIKELSEKYPNGGINIAVERVVQSGDLLLRQSVYTSKFRAFKTGKKQTINLITKNGLQLKCTPNHRILTSNGWKEASRLTTQDDIFVNSEEGIDNLDRIEQNGVEEVYDITEPMTHSFIANGIVVHNCGEVLLYPNEPCNLGSINVWAFAKEDENGNVYYDWNGLKDAVHKCTKLLDNVIDINKFPLKQIEEMSLATRKIGLGIMGLGDLLYELRLSYNTEEGRKFMEKLMQFIAYYSKVESIELAKKRGNLPYYNKSFYNEGKLPFAGFELKEEWDFDWSKISQDIKKYGIRNGYTTIIAPTGSISMIAGCSSGIEPVYSLAFEKNVKVGSFYYVDPAFEKALKKEGIYSDELMEEICNNKGTVQNLENFPKKLQKIFVTALGITPEEHIHALASFQKWVDSSISKTNNFPADATIDHMRESYLLAYKLGCKDVTVFRDSSIKDQVLVAPKKKEIKQEIAEVKQQQTSILNKEGISENDLESGRLVAKGAQAKAKTCPECGAATQIQEGCVSCKDCGWALCK
ncbi:ribonucleoside-diphosphate reductase, adenosylcobalamin-dependent [Candidatus Woesearchaeota archaeon]|nr:ribonucleoside-diphosphate reductase, adenosylcobalamin-dependent [Candidatus Woesearchaeota archaeon]